MDRSTPGKDDTELPRITTSPIKTATLQSIINHDKNNGGQKQTVVCLQNGKFLLENGQVKPLTVQTSHTKPVKVPTVVTVRKSPNNDNSRVTTLLTTTSVPSSNTTRVLYKPMTVNTSTSNMPGNSKISTASLTKTAIENLLSASKLIAASAANDMGTATAPPIVINSDKRILESGSRMGGTSILHQPAPKKVKLSSIQVANALNALSHKKSTPSMSDISNTHLTTTISNADLLNSGLSEIIKQAAQVEPRTPTHTLWDNHSTMTKVFTKDLDIRTTPISIQTTPMTNSFSGKLGTLTHKTSHLPTMSSKRTTHSPLGNKRSIESPGLLSNVPVVAKSTLSNAPVHLDVGGERFTTTLGTLTKYRKSRLAKMFNGKEPICLDKQSNCYFLDRDGKYFKFVLHYLRSSELHPKLLESDSLLNSFKTEAAFYEIDGLLQLLHGVQYKTLELNEHSLQIESKNTYPAANEGLEDIALYSKQLTSYTQGHNLLMAHGYKYSHTVSSRRHIYTKLVVPSQHAKNVLNTKLLVNDKAAQVLAKMVYGSKSNWKQSMM